MPISVEHPLAYYGALSLAMSACLYLFVSGARGLSKQRNRTEKWMATVQQENATLTAQMATIETRLGDWAGRTRGLEETVAGLSSIRRPQAISSGVDANQRTQVLRRARRGDRPEQIAAELRVPKNEVDLLVKVQRAVVRAF